MTLFTQPSKTTGETIPVVFNFQGKLQYGESLNGNAVSCVLYSGTDANPSAMLVGTPVMTATTVTQSVAGGIAGNLYTLVCVATGTNSHNYSMECRLAVITPGGKYST